MDKPLLIDRNAALKSQDSPPNIWVSVL